MISVHGSVVDLEFRERLPSLHSLLRTGPDLAMINEVQAQLDERRVRGIALTPTQGLARGMAVRDTGGITTAFGTMAPALGEGKAVVAALNSLAQQPDASATITRTLFVGLAMIESTAIYCFVVSMILIFANPFWNHVIADVAGK